MRWFRVNKSRIALALAALLLGLAVSLFYIKVGRVIAGAEQYDRQVGYCFDAAPNSPVFLDATRTAGYAWDVWVHDGLAYVADFDSGLTVVDVSVPTQPHPVGHVTWAERYPTAEIVRGEGDVVYVAASDQGLIVLDVSDPARPVVASRYRPRRVGMAEGLAVQEGIVYLAMRSRVKLGRGEHTLELPTVENGLHVLDTRNPYAPSLLGKVNFVGMVEGVQFPTTLCTWRMPIEVYGRSTFAIPRNRC